MRTIRRGDGRLGPSVGAGLRFRAALGEPPSNLDFGAVRTRACNACRDAAWPNGQAFARSTVRTGANLRIGGCHFCKKVRSAGQETLPTVCRYGSAVFATGRYARIFHHGGASPSHGRSSGLEFSAYSSRFPILAAKTERGISLTVDVLLGPTRARFRPTLSCGRRQRLL